MLACVTVVLLSLLFVKHSIMIRPDSGNFPPFKEHMGGFTPAQADASGSHTILYIIS